MKKIVLFALSLLIVAFSASAQIRWEANLGLNISKIKSSQLNSSALCGVNVGARAAYDFNVKGLYANAGAFFSMKGGKYSGDWRACYLEFPIHIGYQYDFSKISVFADAGPYFGIGLFGTINDLQVGEKIKFFSKDGYKRFDFGLGIRGGVNFLEKYVAFIGFDGGLVNFARYSEYYGSAKNTNFFIGIGYRF